MALGPIVVRQTIAAPREQVWQFIADADSRNMWWPETELEMQIGGSVRQTYGRELVGQVDVFVEGQTVGFRWTNGVEDNTSNALILLRPHEIEMEHTVITVLESGFAGHPKAKELLATAEQNWQSLFRELEISIVGEDALMLAEDYADEVATEEVATDEIDTGAVEFADVDTADEDTIVVPAFVDAGDANENNTDGDVAAEDVAEEDIAAEDVAEEDVSEQDIAAEDVAEEDVSEQDIAAEDVAKAADDNAVEDIAVNEHNPDEVIPEVVDDSPVFDDASDSREEFYYEAETTQTPILLPSPPTQPEQTSGILLPEPPTTLIDANGDDLGENDLTGEVPITIVDTGGIIIDDSTAELVIEDDGLTEWERLLQGEPEDE